MTYLRLLYPTYKARRSSARAIGTRSVHIEVIFPCPSMTLKEVVRFFYFMSLFYLLLLLLSPLIATTATRLAFNRFKVAPIWMKKRQDPVLLISEQNVFIPAAAVAVAATAAAEKYKLLQYFTVTILPIRLFINELRDSLRRAKNASPVWIESNVPKGLQEHLCTTPKMVLATVCA